MAMTDSCKSFSPEKAWQKLNCGAADIVLIITDCEEGAALAAYAAQHKPGSDGTEKTRNDLIFCSTDAELLREAEQAGCCAATPDVLNEERERLMPEGPTRAAFFCKAFDASAFTSLVNYVAKGSTIIVRSEDPIPPQLSLSTSRLHYDQLTIIGC